MNKTWLLFLVYFISLPVFSGDEFWKWQEDHKKNRLITDVELSVDDIQYIDNLKVNWAEVAVKNDRFKPIDFPIKLPVKNNIQPKLFNSAKTIQNIITPVELLETPYILTKRIAFDFYQHNLKIKDSVNWTMNTDIKSEKDVILYWQYFSSQSSEILLGQFLMLKETLHLNDWDYAFMLFQYSKIWQKSLNSQLLQTQYLLVQSGYKVHIGFDESSLQLLMNTQHEILNENYVLDERYKRWYVMNFTKDIKVLSSIKWMNQSHKKSKEIFELRMNPDLNLGGQWENKLFNYQIGNEQFDIYVPFNKTMISHYKTYPILSVSSYVNNEIHNVIKQSIVDQIIENIDINNEEQAINFLLNFVQTLIPNNESLIQSKPKLFQQVVFSGKVSVYENILLFKALVDEITGHYMMVVEYEKYLSVGVKLSETHKLKTFHVNLVDYVFADPSYLNGLLGEKMPIEENPFVQWHSLY
ncbi:MAG: hypothetical protein HRU38_08965 [Saccharospirillaceae bacterium]|nr:hypothetical protein [Saccharospirillaceae bacterium]